MKHFTTNRKTILVASALLLFAGCASGPQYKSKTITEYVLTEDSKDRSQTTMDNVTIEDLGDAGEVVAPLKVHACRGGNLLYKKKSECNLSGRCWDVKVPAYESISLLQNAHLRKIKIHNNTEHMLVLDRADAVLVDPAGGEHSFADKGELADEIENNRPCTSTRKLVAQVKKVKLFGDTMRIRPGRNKLMYIAFPRLKIDMPGEWRLEMHNIPVETDAAGNISKAVSFEFPFLMKEIKTKFDYKKDGFFSSWVEVNRTVLQQ